MLNSLLLDTSMMTIQDCLGQRLLCYAIDNDDSTIRVYPQFIIKDKLIEIQEGDRMRLFSSDGSFLLKKTVAMPVIHILKPGICDMNPRRLAG